jgi:hypothetical protein
MRVEIVDKPGRHDVEGTEGTNASFGVPSDAATCAAPDRTFEKVHLCPPCH